MGTCTAALVVGHLNNVGPLEEAFLMDNGNRVGTGYACAAEVFSSDRADTLWRQLRCVRNGNAFIFLVDSIKNYDNELEKFIDWLGNFSNLPVSYFLFQDVNDGYSSQGEIEDHLLEAGQDADECRFTIMDNLNEILMRKYNITPK